MNWIVNNWSLVIVAAAFIACGIFYVQKFLNKPTQEQIENIREWLLYAVAEAEKDLGGGTGKLKLRQVYDAFVVRFPEVAQYVPFSLFSVWVDSALIELKRLLESNNAVKSYVVGKE